MSIGIPVFQSPTFKCGMHQALEVNSYYIKNKSSYLWWEKKILVFAGDLLESWHTRLHYITILSWDFKAGRCAESSKGNSVLPTAWEGKRVRDALSTELKENTYSSLTMTAKHHTNSPTHESNFSQKDIQLHLKKHEPWQAPLCTSL